ncbi:MAG: hypothetical protein ACP5I4_12155 [Oceanipulchritudo sp.]
MSAEKRFNPNWIGLAILIVAYLVSLFEILRPDTESGEPVVDERDVVHFLHWQLEPGFREALDAVIHDYNALPHVREGGYKVKQMAVTERVYSQFLNVHLISGTAPDLATVGKAKMATNKAMFFEPFLDVLEKPNPYNQDPYLPGDIPTELRDFLSTSPWKETFIDGLQASLDPNTGYYYTIPAASWGTVRFFCNDKLLAAVKKVLRQGFSGAEPAPWAMKVLARDPNETEAGMLPDTPALREWIASDRPPETFGQLVLLCEATLQYGRVSGNDKLVPIAGSTYSRDLFASAYNASFFYAWEDLLDANRDGQSNNLELFAAYDVHKWSFADPRMKAYFDLQRKLASYFPTGFLGLDREQANRRFILGNALLLATGAWDAPGIYAGAGEKENPGDRFEVGIINFPLPASNERWGQFDPMERSEGSGGVAGVPMGLYKFSRHKTEAIDFLQYLTSLQPNEKLVRLAGWLPTVIGPEPVDNMKPFLPNIKGVPNSLGVSFTGGNIQTIYNGQYYLLISGDTSYEDFVRNVTAALEDERNGTRREWFEQFRRSRENVRGIERSLSLQRFQQLLQGDLEHEQQRYGQVLQRSSNGLSGLSVKREWLLTGMEEPFPEF